MSPAPGLPPATPNDWSQTLESTLVTRISASTTRLALETGVSVNQRCAMAFEPSLTSEAPDTDHGATASALNAAPSEAANASSAFSGLPVGTLVGSAFASDVVLDVDAGSVGGGGGMGVERAKE